MSLLSSIKSLLSGKGKEYADVNKDGKLDMQDLNAGKDSLTKLADTNKDGNVNQEDLNKVKGYADLNKDGKVNKDDASQIRRNF